MDRITDSGFIPNPDQKKENSLNYLKGIDRNGVSRAWPIPDNATADQVWDIYQEMKAEREAYWEAQFTNRGYTYPQEYELNPFTKKTDLLKSFIKKTDLLKSTSPFYYEHKPREKYTNETITPVQPRDNSVPNGDYIRDLIQELQAESDTRDAEFRRKLVELTSDTQKKKLLLNLPDRT